MRQLCELTEEQYEKLHDSGMLWEVYPEATGNYKVDTQPRQKMIVINHAGCYECPVYLTSKGDYVISQDHMEDIVDAVGDFDAMVLAHILDRLQEANNE